MKITNKRRKEIAVEKQRAEEKARNDKIAIFSPGVFIPLVIWFLVLGLFLM